MNLFLPLFLTIFCLSSCSVRTFDYDQQIFAQKVYKACVKAFGDTRSPSAIQIVFIRRQKYTCPNSRSLR